MEFTASQLASSGSPTPATILSASTGFPGAPSGLAFDAAGNLWVALFADSAVVEFTPSQLAAGGSPTPTVALSAASGSLSDPAGLAFDASGDLWVANARNTVVEFTPSQLAAGGSLTPAVTLGATASSLDNPVALAVDASGDLWVANLDGTVVEFTASEIVASGSPAPNVIVSGSSVAGASGLAFDPHAANLPVKP